MNTIYNLPKSPPRLDMKPTNPILTLLSSSVVLQSVGLNFYSFSVSKCFKASHSNLIYIIMNCNLTLESVLAKEDVDHCNVLLPGIIGGWTRLGDKEKDSIFFAVHLYEKFCCTNWYFVAIQKKLLDIQLAHISKDIFIRLKGKNCNLWLFHD